MCKKKQALRSVLSVSTGIMLFGMNNDVFKRKVSERTVGNGRLLWKWVI